MDDVNTNCPQINHKLKKGCFRKRLTGFIFPLSIIQIILYIFALGLLGFSIFYWVRIISQDLWDELWYRIIIMVLTIGAVMSFVLARVLYNQAKILRQLKTYKEKNDKADE